MPSVLSTEQNTLNHTPHLSHGPQIKPLPATSLRCSVLEQKGVYWYQHEAFSRALEQRCMHCMQLLRLDSTKPTFSSANGSFLSIPGIHSSGRPVATLVDPLPHKPQVCINTPAINISLARVHFCPFTTGVALDVATPKKLAVALPHT